MNLYKIKYKQVGTEDVRETVAIAGRDEAEALADFKLNALDPFTVVEVFQVVGAKRFKELKLEAFEAGENDTVTEDHLVQGAELWLDIPEELTDEQRNELIEEYRLGFLGERLPRPVQKAIDSIANATSWDNWENEAEEGETVTYWKTCEVLHCKLEHMRDFIAKLEEAGEFNDTLDQLQELLASLKEYSN